MKRILILGGSGFVGRQLCKALSASDVKLTIPSRQRHVPELIQHSVDGKPIRFVTTDVIEGPDLPALIREHDVVINLIAILHGKEQSFQRIHVDWVNTLAQSCAGAGIEHLIHVSALGADIQGPSMYLRSKGRGEKTLLRLRAVSGFPVTILRPSVIFGLDDQFLNTFARIQRYAPFVPLTGAQARFQPVWVGDVARALSTLALLPPGPVPIFEACGPEIFSLAELVRQAGRWAGNQRPILPLPARLGKCQAWFMEHLPGKTLMSRDNVDSLSVDNVASGNLPGLTNLGITPAKLDWTFP